jgi:3-dehydroquinate dehydratase
MGVFTRSSHEYWATVSGHDLDDLLDQADSVLRWGCVAVEFRADLIPLDVYERLLDGGAPQYPAFVAHFGTGGEADTARNAVLRAVEAGYHGAICHSRCEALDEIVDACRAEGRPFAAAYHSQEPMSRTEAAEEFERQEETDPLFRKIAVRAHRFEDAVALLEATRDAASSGGSPVVGAIFGPHRWARVAMPHAGSTISFVLAHRAVNEQGGDDEQLVIDDVARLQAIGGLLPATAEREPSAQPV